MDNYKLEISQMLKEHPVLQEKDTYKSRYIKLLEYFARKYSMDDKWANGALRLYKGLFLNNQQDYNFTGFSLREESKPVISTKFKPFKFFSYRYCVIIDCIFINAINDKEKGEQIFSELSSIYHNRYLRKLRQVFDAFFDPTIALEEIEQTNYLFSCWKRNVAFLKNKPIKVIVTATMSAGKSTLLNALVGKKINRTQNDACTAKIHTIRNKPYEDGYCYESDYDLELDANLQTLMDDNIYNVSKKIDVGTYFRTVGSESQRLWLIDTPGVNSSQDKEHKEITNRCIIESKADLLIYLLNGENIGSEDDREHLQFVLDNYHGKIVFVVNKLDKFRKNEDSVSETLSATYDDLKSIGFSDPLVVPISASAAYLAKMSIWGDTLDEDDQDEYNRMARKLKKKEYQFDTYYSRAVTDKVSCDNTEDNYQLLLHSGVLQLEQIIYGVRG